jgi:hypothetical protein
MSIKSWFWFCVAKTYLAFRRAILFCKSLFLRGARSAIFYGLIIVIIAQAIFFVLTVEKVHQLKTDFAEYQDNSLMMLNRIYSQVFLLNTRVNQVLTEKK